MQYVEALKGYKTYGAAVGLLGLAIYQLTHEQPEAGIQSLLAALAAFGLRNAIGTKEGEGEK